MMAFGTLEPLGELAALNGLGVTSSPPPGTVLQLPDATTDKAVLRAFADYNTIVAVSVSEEPEDDLYYEEDYIDEDYI